MAGGEEPGATLFEELPGLFALMARQVIEDHDVARIECRRELGFDVDLQDLLGHRPVDDPRGGQAIAGGPVIYRPVPQEKAAGTTPFRSIGALLGSLRLFCCYGTSIICNILI